MATKINTDIATAREQQVIDMRVRRRMQFREIATELGINVKSAHEAWKRGMRRWAEAAAEQRDAEIGRQLATLEALLDGLMPKAITGDARAAEVIIKALDRHARLLGLDAPVKVDAKLTDALTAEVEALADEIAERAR
ncbi:hypothetical protein AB0F64_37490 [Streptomyces sp. NPDC026294]|uniref:hypothetical protein n=1 Tax=Streptomyces sp. NPDC026294 TaxID=3155362 RepID=UPI0033F4CDC5